MAENILRKLVNNSQMAIDDGVYDVDANLEKSTKDFIQIINANPHATLLTEVKFASPSLGKIRTLTDPVSIANQMITGGSKALSVLTQPHLFHGSPEYFMKVREAVNVPMLMKDIMIDKIQIDTAKKIGAECRTIALRPITESKDIRNKPETLPSMVAIEHLVPKVTL